MATTVTYYEGNQDATVDMVDMFEKMVEKNAATFVVFYRGIW